MNVKNEFEKEMPAPNCITPIIDDLETDNPIFEPEEKKTFGFTSYEAEQLRQHPEATHAHRIFMDMLFEAGIFYIE